MNVFEGIACRKCGAPTLRLEWRLGGRAMLRHGEIVATEWPYCVCNSCGGESRGIPEEGRDG